jgi:hypothetical protein
MINHHRLLRPFFVLSFLFFSTLLLHAQSPGIIVRPAGGPGSSVLNPDQNAWTSATTAGYTTNDITQSEIPYKIIKPITAEPSADLATGPDNGYSDIVKTVDGSGCYMYNNGTNFLFRFRIGAIVSGAKAYNLLIDTDMKLGATGTSADPNYVPATNSGNGNPGFEIEIAFQTGSSIAIYNVDGTMNPSVSYSYSLSTNSIVSVALSRDNSNADYFYDFYVPLSALSALGLSTSTPFRIVTTTNTNPGSAFQGTRSDIYGINDELFPNTTDAWEYVGKNTPSVTLNDLTSGGSGYPDICTAPPVVTTGIAAGTSVSVGGTWTRLDADKPGTATITIYKNGVSQGTTTCNTGGSWSFTVATLATGDVITAKAQATGESMCLVSNSVAVTSCAPANISSTSALVVSCLSNRGAGGTRTDGSRVKIYTIAYNGNLTLFADDATTTYKTLYNGTSNPVGTTVWEYQHSSNGGTADPCGGGAPDMPTTNSYAFTITESGKCESAPVWPTTCLIASTTATPTITQTSFFTGLNTISGTSTEAGATTIRLFVNGFIVSSVNVAANAAYGFTNIALQTGDVVTVRAQASAKCISAAASTVTTACFTAAPKITTDVQGYLATGATTISGTSGEVAGTTIRVYASPATLLATTTVQAGGSWSASVTALTGGTSYYATAQNGTCSVSASSATATARAATTVCPSITGTYTEGTNIVAGTLPSLFTGTVYLYQDDAQIGSVAVTASLIWSITVSASTPLYNGGVLTVGAQATNSTLNKSCGSTTTVSCSLPGTPVVSPLISTISSGQTVTFNVTGAESGVLYSVINTGSGISYASSVFGTGTDQSLVTNVFTTPGVYNISIVGDKLSGGCLSATAAVVTVNGTLPLTWRSFTVTKQVSGALLNWVTASESNTTEFEVQYSPDGNRWTRIGTVAAAGNTFGETSYRFLHPDPVTGMNYYRLLQKDLDGRSTYSTVLPYFLGNNDQLRIYPNPVSGGKLFVRIAVTGTMAVYTIEGRLVQQQPLIAGTQEIDISRLPKGIYHLRIGEHHEPLIVQ